jgi:hypothetical protein
MKGKKLVKQLELFPEVIQNAAQHYSPALLANFTYDLFENTILSTKFNFRRRGFREKEFNCLKKWQIRLRHHLSY